MALFSKKALGIIFPILLGSVFIFLYIGWIIFLYFLNTSNMFASAGITAYSIIYLIIYHLLTIMIIYCYFYTMCANPGEPPQYWGFYYESPDVRKQRYFN